MQLLSMVEPSFTRCHQNHHAQHLMTLLLLSSVLASALNSKPMIALMSYGTDTFPNVSKVEHVTREQTELTVGHVNALQVMQRFLKAKTPGKRSWQILQTRRNCLSFCHVRQLKKVFYPDSNDVVVHIGHGDEMMVPSNNEEAHTRIVVHIIDALPNATSILIRTGDTDVYIILVGHFFRFHSIYPNLNLWIPFGGGKHQQMLNINRLHQSIDPDRCLS